ncbi:Lon protease [Bienertia sinuspersici]
MANDQWVNIFSTAQAVFLPAGISDHSPGVLVGNNDVGKGKKPFKYFNMWSTAPDYKDRIKRGWSQECQGCLMFQLRQKLKAIKQELKELNKMHFSNIHLEIEDAHKSLLQIQKELQGNPTNRELCYMERRATDQYKKKLHCYVQFLQQKARIKWLQEGDDNTSLFHSSLRDKRLRSNLYSIYNMQGQLQSDPNSVSKAFLDYYEQLIGTTDDGERQQVEMEVVEYSQNVLKLITTWLGSGRTYQDLESAFKWINRRLNQQKVKQKVWNVAINAVVYCIWQARNSLVWRSHMQQEDQLAKQIMFLVLSRLNKIRGRKMKPKDEDWIDSLYNYNV